MHCGCGRDRYLVGGLRGATVYSRTNDGRPSELWISEIECSRKNGRVSESLFAHPKFRISERTWGPIGWICRDWIQRVDPESLGVGFQHQFTGTYN